jgi:hypothetical protein
MKKLVMTAALGLTMLVTPAFAQTGNSSGVYQYGWSNSASVDQALGAGAANTSDVNQGIGGNGNAATSSAVDVTQIGGNGSIVGSSIVQNDTIQNATVIQNAGNGGTLTSTINQSINNNTARVTQTSDTSNTSQTSIIYQTGQYGAATVDQSGVSDTSRVDQSGYGNSGAGQWVYSSANGGWTQVAGGVNVSQSGTFANNSYVAQDSDNSGVAVTQSAYSGSNSSYVGQLAGGANNYALVKQH